MISIAFVKQVVFPVVNTSDAPVVLEGAEAYDILCPVSSVTGCRENPLALLKSLVNDPAKSRALDSILMELPSISAPNGLTNEQMFEQLQSVFEDSTFFDNDKFAERLMNISSDLLKMQGVNAPIQQVQKPSNESVVEPSVEPTVSA